MGSEMCIRDRSIYAPEYVPPEKGSSKPTPIPRKKILAFSLTPQAEANTVGSESDIRDKPIAETTSDSENEVGQNKSRSVHNETSVNGSCNRNAHKKIDTSSIAIAFMLMGLVLRKRIRT